MKLNYINGDVISECTSVGIKIGRDIILAKNRDRTYNPNVKIIREMIDGTEVIYMYDVDTDYSEGMNEYGIGIVNTTLQGKEDEKAIKVVRKHKKLSADGHKIRHALSMNNVEDIIECLDLYKRGLGGHTTVGHKKGFSCIEKLRMGKPNITHLSVNDVVVRTNHGLQARTAKNPEQLLAHMRKHHGLPGYLEPYRTNYKVWTSSQILLNLSKLEMLFVLDENTKLLGIENKLPQNYKPKIKLRLYELDTEYKVTEIPHE